MNTIAHTGHNCPRHPDLDGPPSCDRCEQSRPQANGHSPSYTLADLRNLILAFAREREVWQAREHAAYQAGYRQAETDRDGWPGFAAALRQAHAAGQAAAYASADDAFGPGAFDAGWAACLDQFADLIGGRAYPAHPTGTEIKRWTRHAPRCRHGARGGSQSCQRAGCLPGPRADYAKAAPWDRPQAGLVPRARASWGLK